MRSREGKLEDYFKGKLKELGADKLKWVSPGNDGVPDDWVLFLGKAWCVEIKNEDGRLRPTQKNMIPRIAKNYPVYILYGRAEVDNFINDEIISHKNSVGGYNCEDNIKFYPQTKSSQLNRRN